MSYQVLARKWRPQRFDDVTGQEHVTTALRNAIAQGRVPHAVLLCGPRGVGKTTIARILARCLNCEKGPTATPCGQCPSCTEIAAGTSTDVQEIDAASRTSVDDVRELIESIRYAPSPGKHRIYVVDEVHMLSVPAFNALLKTLEEPPPRSLFVFATTNPEKIPFTVTSRCQRYDLRRLPTAEIAARLGEVAKAEGVAISAHGLQAIARESQGSLRDGLTLLDQVIAVGGTEVDDERVAQVLDLIPRHVLLEAVAACVDADPTRALAAVARAAELGIDARRLGGELLRVLRDLVVLRVAPDAPELVEGSDAELEELRALAARADAGRVRRMFRALLREQEDLAWAPEPMAVLEMALVRLAGMASGEDAAALLARLDALERRLGGGGADPGAPGAGGGGAGGPGPRAAAERGPRAGARPAPRARADASEGEADGGLVARRAPDPEVVGSDPAARLGAVPDPAGSAPREDAAGAVRGAAPAPGAPPPRGPARGVDSAAGAPDAAGADTPAVDDAAPLPAVLDRLRSALAESDRALALALEDATLVERQGPRLVLAVAEPFAARRLERRLADLEAAAQRLFGRPLRFTIRAPEAAPPRPAAALGARAPRSEAEEEAARRRRREALDHPAVNAALEILGGDVVEIRPLSGAPPPPGGAK